MAVVMLVSGGLDSTIMALMAHEEGLTIHPLFVNYGQRAVENEWLACRTLFKRHRLPKPVRVDIPGFGRRVPSGLTSKKLDVVADVYLPGRNLLLLLTAGAYAAHLKATSIAIGLLNENHRLFEDQSQEFLIRAQSLLRTATATEISVLGPLMRFTKGEVIELALQRKVRGTYSCHAGTKTPCGRCVSCHERARAEDQRNGR
jgi:7-cyano-7-deazaguanine synthase